MAKRGHTHMERQRQAILADSGSRPSLKDLPSDFVGIMTPMTTEERYAAIKRCHGMKTTSIGSTSFFLQRLHEICAALEEVELETGSAGERAKHTAAQVLGRLSLAH